jgi:hypothetical protein
LAETTEKIENKKAKDDQKTREKELLVKKGLLTPHDQYFTERENQLAEA